VAGPEAHGLAGSHRYRRFNPALGFNYDVDVRLALFGSYSEAMRAPTSIEHSCADPENPCALPTGFNGDPELRAVTAKTFELGGRGRLGGVLSWNAAAYRSRIGNDIQFIATSNSYGYFANVGDTERRGVELGLQGRWNRLFLSANYGLVEAVYKSTFVTAAGEAVASGDRIPGVAASSFKLRAVVDVTPGLSVGGTLVAAGGQYAHGNESNRDPDGRVPGYSVVNLDLNYRYSAALRFTAQVHNAFDQRYSTYGLSGITSLYTLVNQQFQTPAPPRAVWVGATFSFGGKAEKPLQSAD
jgi:outer membrane receptor protein involved in Fe transport